MKQRRGTGDEELAIMMEGLKEKRSVAEIGHWIEVGYNKLGSSRKSVGHFISL